MIEGFLSSPYGFRTSNLTTGLPILICLLCGSSRRFSTAEMLIRGVITFQLLLRNINEFNVHQPLAITDSKPEDISSLPKPHEQLSTHLSPGTPARAGLKRRRSSSVSSNNSSGSDPSSPIPIGSPASSPPCSEHNPNVAEKVTQESTSFRTQANNNTLSEIRKRVEIGQRLPHSLAADMDRLHGEYPDDLFEIRDWIADFEIECYYEGFKVFCRECPQWTFKIDDRERSFEGVEKHLKSTRHTSFVLLRLKRERKVPQETPACTLRMESLQRLADQKGYSLDSMSRFIYDCANGDSGSAPTPTAQSSSNVPNMNGSTNISISRGEASRPSATSKGPLFGRTHEEADQDRAFLDSMFDAQLPHITNAKAQVRTPVESQSLAALRSDFSRRLDTLEDGDRNKQLQLERHKNCITEADVKIRGMEKKIKTLEGSRDELCVSRINGVQESVRANIQILENVQRNSSTKVDGILGTVDRLYTRTANVQKLILRHSDDITDFRALVVETRASLESLKRRREDSDKTESEMKRRILDLEKREEELQKENQAFRKKTEDRFEGIIRAAKEKFETLSKRQKEDVDALRKDIKDLEMVGEQQRSQISNLKTQLSLQIAQSEGISTRQRSTRSTAAASLRHGY
jgi:hypothetical protein